MRSIVIGIAVGLALGLSTAAAQSPSWRPPTESQRCPSKWGASDERGSANHMKPESVLRATRFIKTGEVIELGHVLNSSIPLVGTRRFDVHTKRTFMNQVSNRRASNEELVVAELGQVGNDLARLAEAEARPQLQPVRGSKLSQRAGAAPATAPRRGRRSGP